MKKIIPQDIVPGKRSIRDISLPDRSRGRATFRTTTSTNVKSTMDVKRAPAKSAQTRVRQAISEIDEREEEVRNEDQNYNFDYDIDRPKKKNRTALFAMLAIFVLALAFGIVTFFSSARVVVSPKSQTIPANMTITALKDQASGQFGYQIVSVTASVNREVTATSEQQTSIKAKGNIVVYNTSNAAQKLVATTRFETPGGLIYRAVSAVTVPKATVVGGKSTPGSATVAVVADAAGEKYNIGLTDFTLPGFKNTAQFKTIYGRSATLMTGGFVGMRKNISTADMTQASADMEAGLRENLTSQITAQLPANFILYPQSITYDLAAVSQTSSASSSDKATLTRTGTAQAIIFDRSLLSQAILAKAISSSTDARVVNLDALTFTLKEPEVISKNYTGSVTFGIIGDVRAVWNFDAATLKSDLLGLKKGNLDSLLRAKYPAIDSVSASLFPVWKGSFPGSPDRISISEVER